MHAAISQINFQLTLEKEQSLTNKCHYQFTLDKIKMTLDWKERFVQLTLDCNRWQFSCLYIFALLKTWHWCPAAVVLPLCFFLDLKKLDLQFHHITVTVCNCNIELGTIYIPKKISTYMSVHIYEIRYLN